MLNRKTKEQDTFSPELISKSQHCYDYPRPSMAVDIIVFKDNGDLPYSVLLIKRGNEPFKDCYSFPGGFMDMNETLIQSAKRELEEETGLRVPALTPLGLYDKVDRDPRGRVISQVFKCVIKSSSEPQAGDDAVEAKFFPLDKLPRLAFDHEQILEDAVRTLS